MKNLVFAIQPIFIPWIGFYDMIDKSEKFVILDDVQFNTRSWQQRNKIKSSNGLQWISVPVKKKNLGIQKINEVQIFQTEIFISDFKKKISYNYSKSKYFEKYKDEFFKIVESALNDNLLYNLNIKIIKWTLKKLNIEKEILLSSDLKVKPRNKSDRVIKICENLNSNSYLCNEGAKKYLTDEKNNFKKNHINIFCHKYQHPKYNQLFGIFEEYASSLDLLFNEGDNSYDIIKSGAKEIERII